MKYTMTTKGNTITIDSETGIITGNTYGARNTIKDEFDAKWDGDAKVWIADVERLNNQLSNSNIRLYLERAFRFQEVVEPTKIEKLVTKQSDNKPCPRCGTYCYGDCSFAGKGFKVEH